MCEKSCGETGPMHFSSSADRNLWQPWFIDQRCVDYSDGWLVGMPKTLNFSLQGIDHHEL